MATISFERSLEIRTDAEAENMLKALEKAEARGHVELPDFSEEFARGREFAKRGPPQ